MDSSKIHGINQFLEVNNRVSNFLKSNKSIDSAIEFYLDIEKEGFDVHRVANCYLDDTHDDFVLIMKRKDFDKVHVVALRPLDVMNILREFKGKLKIKYNL